MRRWLWTALFVCAIIGIAAGCGREPEKRYDLKGKVVAVDKNLRQVTIAHEKIPGFMDAMTMPFTVRDDWALDALAPGQSVAAALVVAGDRSWLEIRNISKADPGKDAAAVQGPKIGDEVPDFSLLDQDNRRIHLNQYRGRPLLLTFIYTRCPLPDYCPRTSRNFSDVYHALRSNPPSGKKPMLLTVSFDTENDTPAVLREYAARYMRPVNFKDWSFATGSLEEIKKITAYFGLRYWPESGQISHNLVTALIAPDGKIERMYLGNQWQPSDILSALGR